MISEVDIRDWDRAEKIIEQIDVIDHDEYRNGALTVDEYIFLIKLIDKARATPKSKIPAILSWFKP